ncbi:MAG: glycine betaine ABC transporter substrate-binding protein, partial [Candidatus Paceibacteria bacterium]
LDIAGINVAETWLGLGVPEYTDDSIQSIEDLKGESEFAKAVNNEITGIGDGAGITKNTKKALEEYGLKDQWNLKTSSSSAMLTALQDTMKNEDPIIATVWKPHSAFALSKDMRQLEDPKNIYNDAEATKKFLEENASEFATEEIKSKVKSDVLATVVYKGFKDDAPAAYEMLNNFRVPASTQSDWIYQLSIKDKDAETIAEEYIKNNQDKVESWMP